MSKHSKDRLPQKVIDDLRTTCKGFTDEEVLHQIQVAKKTKLIASAMVILLQQEKHLRKLNASKEQI